MKIILKHLHHKPSASLIAMIEQQLGELGRTRQIDEARIVIERRMEASPPFRISAHLVTPGPDVFADAADHTLRAALQKTFTQLAEEIGRRHLKRAGRVRNTPRTGPPTQVTAANARN